MRLNLSQSQGFSNHRSGWSYCLDSLRAYHSDAGIFVCDFIERQFSWELSEYFGYGNRNKLPYTQPWVGFLHNPHNMPEWFDYFNSPQAIFARPVFQKSLEKCRALVVLSDYLADWVRSQTQVPVISVKHPTGHGQPWSPHKFLKQDFRRVVQVGYWLRRLESIAELKVPTGYKKVWLPSNRKKAAELIEYQELRSMRANLERDNVWATVEILDFISNEKFDNLYSDSVVFVDLYDSSANNAVVEAIARSTPIIVNRHPAVIEYLGVDYPLYFDHLDEIYDILRDTELIISAHEYLKSMDKFWINGRYFAYNIKQELERIL
jgi:glycosyltransferase involved in cell wall biosynthesis